MRQGLYLGDIDCYAFLPGGGCDVMDIKGGCLVCQGQKCSMQKSDKDYAGSCIDALVRIKHLPSDQRTEIVKKYYGGKDPWKDIL